MIRKVYLDFIWQKLTGGQWTWLFKRGIQFGLIHASFALKRPLCGPILGSLVTNYSCNYRCIMCDMPSRDPLFRARGLKEMSTDEMKSVLKEFAALGISGVGFTGGEPLLRKDIMELLRYCKELKMVSHLNTNAFFVDEAKAAQIIASGVDSINVSLDGAVAATHDAIRGCPGAFEKVMRALKALQAERQRRKARVRIKVVCVLGPQNIDEVPAFIALAEKLGVDCVEVIPQQPFTTSKEGPAQVFDEAFLAKVRNQVAYLQQEQKKGKMIENSPRHLAMIERSFRGEPMPLDCYAGYNSLGVDCYGEIYPCVPWFNWGRSAGNVHGQSLKAWWYSREAQRLRENIARCEGCYLNCQAELNIVFSRCRHK